MSLFHFGRGGGEGGGAVSMRSHNGVLLNVLKVGTGRSSSDEGRTARRQNSVWEIAKWQFWSLSSTYVECFVISMM